MIPLDGLKKSLENSRGDTLIQRDRFDDLLLQLREQATDVGGKKSSTFDAVETIRKKSKELGKYFSVAMRYL